MGSIQVRLNGAVVWAYVVEHDGGLRVRVSADDWERLSLFRGQRIAVRLPGRADARLYLTGTEEAPPLVWASLAQRVRTAG
jgi:hypothetical protein